MPRFRLKDAVYRTLRKVANRDDNFREIPDPVPLAPPIGWFKQPSMFDQVRDMVRSEHMRLYAASQGAETFEEASDFDVDDDMFPASQYEDAADFEPLADLQARRQAEFDREYRAKREERRRKREEREWALEDRPAASSGAPAAPRAAEGGSEPKASGSPS